MYGTILLTNLLSHSLMYEKLHIMIKQLFSGFNWFILLLHILE